MLVLEPVTLLPQHELPTTTLKKYYSSKVNKFLK